MVEEKKICDCYTIVRDDFFKTALRIIEVEGEFPRKVAVDYLRGVENLDGRLAVFDCISMRELAKRREETGKLIEELK